VAASLPVNNPSSDTTRLIASWIADGAIGKVREIHNWSSRPYWPQGVPRPAAAETVPEGLDWDLWVGPAPERPYHGLLPSSGAAGTLRLRFVRDMGATASPASSRSWGLKPPTA